VSNFFYRSHFIAQKSIIVSKFALHDDAQFA